MTPLLLLRTSLVCAGLMCLHTGAAAAEMRLAQALSLAASEHPSVKAKQAELQAAQADLETAKWSRFPTVSTEVTASGGRPAGALLVQQPLWTGGKIDAQNRLAQANVALAQASLQEARMALMQDTGQQFFEALRWQQRLEIAEKNETEHRKLFELIERRVTAQISPLTDQILATARLQQAVSERIQFKRAVQTAELALQQLVGVLPSNLLAPRNLPLTESSVDWVIDVSKANSAQLLRLRTLQEVAQAQIETAKATYFPSLALSHRRALGASEVGVDPSRTFLSLQFTPGPGLSAQSVTAAARSRLENSQQNALIFERQLEQQVRTALSDLEALGQQVEPAQLLVGATEDVVASYLRQYQIGKKNWLDVLNALRENAQASYSAVDVNSSTQLMRLRTLLLTGQLTWDNLSTLHD
jgi:outer membrane protein, adhesin transport system